MPAGARSQPHRPGKIASPYFTFGGSLRCRCLLTPVGGSTSAGELLKNHQHAGLMSAGNIEDTSCNILHTFLQTQLLQHTCVMSPCRTIKAWYQQTWFPTRWTWAWTRPRRPWWPKSWGSCCWRPSLWAVTFPEPRCQTTTTSPETWCCPLWGWSWENACCWMTWRSEEQTVNSTVVREDQGGL